MFIKKVLKISILLFMCSLIGADPGSFQDKSRGASGTVNGEVREKLTRAKIAGITVAVKGLDLVGISDEEGNFYIRNIPPGSYSLRFTGTGYKGIIKTDIIVKPARTTRVDVILSEEIVNLEESVSVHAEYFHKDEKNPVSIFNLSSEEVRRAPGTAGDVSRMLKSMPGVTSRTDDSSELIVRGGSALENGYYIDNIRVPSIDHLAAFGSTGGLYSSIDPDLIQNVDFYSGGFSVNYGNALSSVTDITLSEGSREAVNGQFDINLMQSGAIFEGPINHGKGSWIFSLRKSYFKVLKSAKVLNEQDNYPDTLDSLLKVVYDLSDMHRISFLHYQGKSDFMTTVNVSSLYLEHSQSTVGVNLTSNWSPTFYSNTSLSYSRVRREDRQKIDQHKQFFDYHLKDKTKFYHLRNMNYLVIDSKNKLDFGINITKESVGMNHGVNVDWPDKPEELALPEGGYYDYSTVRTSLFASYICNLFDRLTITAGLRYDYSSSFEGRVFNPVSPRLSLSYQLTRQLTLNAGYGIFYQSIPLNYLAYIPESKMLRPMRADHFTAGLEYMTGTGIRIMLEGYYKRYYDQPIDPDKPEVLITDYTADRISKDYYSGEAYYIPEDLTGRGAGYAWGLELFIQKKLTDKFYGMISATYYRSKYRDLDGHWKNRMYDNRYLANITLGYKFNRNWEVSMKFTTIGGSPYTPVDIHASEIVNRKWQDRERINAARYPYYSSLNLRVDRTWFMGNSSVMVYLDVWNAFNRKNVRRYWWDRGLRRINANYQMPIVPVIGIEYEF